MLATSLRGTVKVLCIVSRCSLVVSSTDTSSSFTTSFAMEETLQPGRDRPVTRLGMESSGHGELTWGTWSYAGLSLSG
jgi:hypothetical protein